MNEGTRRERTVARAVAAAELREARSEAQHTRLLMASVSAENARLLDILNAIIVSQAGRVVIGKPYIDAATRKPIITTETSGSIILEREGAPPSGVSDEVRAKSAIWLPPGHSGTT